MKTGFKNSIEPPEGKKIKSPWNFDCPSYDERTSCYVNAGSHYGVGKRQNVGTKKHESKSAVPFGRVNTMIVDEIPRKNLPINLEE